MKNQDKTKGNLDVPSQEDVTRIANEAMRAVTNKKLITEIVDFDIANHPEKWPQVQNDQETRKHVIYTIFSSKSARLKRLNRKGYTTIYSSLMKLFSNEEKNIALNDAKEIFKNAFSKTLKTKA